MAYCTNQGSNDTSHNVSSGYLSEGMLTHIFAYLFLKALQSLQFLTLQPLDLFFFVQDIFLVLNSLQVLCPHHRKIAGKYKPILLDIAI